MSEVTSAAVSSKVYLIHLAWDAIQYMYMDMCGYVVICMCAVCVVLGTVRPHLSAHICSG
jgi:hypothetical protein